MIIRQLRRLIYISVGGGHREMKYFPKLLHFTTIFSHSLQIFLRQPQDEKSGSNILDLNLIKISSSNFIPLQKVLLKSTFNITIL